MRRNGIKFELIVRDQDWTKIETIKISPQNFSKIMKDVGDRYGIDKKMLTPAKEIQEEIDWMRKEKIL